MAQKFQTLDQYTELSKKVIRQFASKHADRLLRSDEAIGVVASEMMMADWEWRQNGGRNRNSFRINKGKFAVLNYLRNSMRRERRYGTQLTENFIDPRNEDWKTKRAQAVQQCNELIRLSGLSEIQERVIQMYYFGQMKIPAIATELGVSNQAVQQALERARNKMRSIAEVEI